MGHVITGLHLIKGEWIRSAGPTFHGENPATGESLSPAINEAGNAEVDAALTAAAEAFSQTHDLPYAWQANLLDTIAVKIMDLGDALLERIEQETALPRQRLITERARTIWQCKMFAQVVRDGAWLDATIDTADPNRAPPKPDLRRINRPRGPVVVFGASNFPLAYSVCGGDTASALAAGCPVVAKGHPSHPGTAELVASAVLEALKEQKLPLGLFGMVQGRTNEMGAALVKHPATTAVGFTGSNRGGRALFDLAAARPVPIPVYAEMGSLNPVVILPSALAERRDAIAKGLAGSVTLGGGQFCTKPGLIFVVGDESHGLVEALRKEFASISPVTMLSKPLRDTFNQRTSEFSKVSGVKPIIETHAEKFAGASPALFETTSETWLREKKLREEAFGPGTVVIHCKNAAEAAAGVRAVGGSLTGTAHIGDRESKSDVATVVHALEDVAGRIVFNGYPTGVEVNHAIVHGGPYPATTDAGSTSVGTAAIRRFVRLVAFQSTPDDLLPAALKNSNPLKISRMVNGKLTTDPVPSS